MLPIVSMTIREGIVAMHQSLNKTRRRLLDGFPPVEGRVDGTIGFHGNDSWGCHSCVKKRGFIR